MKYIGVLTTLLCVLHHFQRCMESEWADWYTDSALAVALVAYWCAVGVCAEKASGGQ